MNINKPEILCKVSMSILFMSIFIGAFFFTYVAYIEKQVIKNQMDFLVNNLKNSTNMFGKNINDAIKQKINNISVQDLSVEDKLVEQHNKKIIKNVININIIAVVVVSVILYFINTNYNNGTFNIKSIFKNNLIILVCIAFTEFLFITFFGANYISIEPNTVFLTILTNLKKYKYI